MLPRMGASRLHEIAQRDLGRAIGFGLALLIAPVAACSLGGGSAGDDYHTGNGGNCLPAPPEGGGQFMEPCSDAVPCADGQDLVCFQYNRRGSVCTTECTTDADCPAPSRGCNNKGVCKVLDSCSGEGGGGGSGGGAGGGGAGGGGAGGGGAGGGGAGGGGAGSGGGGGGGAGNGNGNGNQDGPRDGGYATCSSCTADPDGDGWGYEDEATCIAPTDCAAFAICRSCASDPDLDGWGQEDGSSCLIAAECQGYPVCSSCAADEDGDGWGYEGGRSCIAPQGCPRG
jgi:hypothetical protein